jgi:hypothetical protein
MLSCRDEPIKRAVQQQFRTRPLRPLDGRFHQVTGPCDMALARNNTTSQDWALEVPTFTV